MSHEKEGTAETTQKNSFWSTKITGISLPLYLLIVLILIVTMALGKLPKGILGPLAVLVIFGNLFHFLGNKIPIIKSYLGGGSVFAIFASAALATFNILPHAVLQDTSNFINNMGFLDFYIAALITGSILGMDRDTLIKASVRFIPVALIAMVSSFFAVGFVGMLIGNGFGNSVLYISLPAMAGGVGAGAVPLSSIYAHVLGTDASQVISRLIPATAMTNVLAIIGAALLARAGESKPGFSGQGKLVKTGSLGDASARESKLNIPQFGVGLMVAM
ncbi:MAG: 2-hydroxycarboxylate transporter family protein, partial [Enterococcus italicus]